VCEDLIFHNPDMSFKSIQEDAGYSRTSNHLWQIFEGRIPISSSAVTNYCTALGLNKHEIKYFRLMVEFDKAKNDKEKNSIIQKMSNSKLFSKANQKYIDVYNIYSTWYLPILWDLVLLDDFQEDYKWIADKLFFDLSEPKIRKGFKKLIDAGLLVRDKKGKLKQKKTEFFGYESTADVVNSISITAGRNYIREMLKICPGALEDQPYDKRIFYSANMAITQKDAEEIIKKIIAFNKELSSVKYEKKEDLYQLNLQFFSHTKLD
jgi:uncharacterized protein (TIGR02147 family)